MRKIVGERCSDRETDRERERIEKRGKLGERLGERFSARERQTERRIEERDTPPVQTGPRLAGKVPPSGTFPGNHIVWTLAGTCPRVPTKHVGFRGRKSTLGLVIDIAQLFSSNVRMREMCWHGDLTQSRCAQQKPLNRDCPRQAGAFDDRVDGRS